MPHQSVPLGRNLRSESGWLPEDLGLGNRFSLKRERPWKTFLCLKSVPEWPGIFPEESTIINSFTSQRERRPTFQ